MLLKSFEVSNILSTIGLKSGDNIFLHVDAFVCAFLHGKDLNEKIDTLIDGIINLIGTDGTLVLPTFSYSATKNEIFDKENTPSEVGLITENFRKKNDVYRSNNPIFSVASFGKLSKKFETRSLVTLVGHQLEFTSDDFRSFNQF